MEGLTEFTPEELAKDFDTCHNHSVLEKLKIIGKLVH